MGLNSSHSASFNKTSWPWMARRPKQVEVVLREVSQVAKQWYLAVTYLKRQHHWMSPASREPIDLIAPRYSHGFMPPLHFTRLKYLRGTKRGSSQSRIIPLARPSCSVCPLLGQPRT